jgi:FeS assembly SUF system protein
MSADTPTGIDPADIERRIVEALKTVFDPEIPVNIYELGLIYSVDVSADGDAVVRMTLTAPACPAAGILPGEVEGKAREVAGVKDARVELVWDPPWSPDRMTDAARLQLGLM